MKDASNGYGPVPMLTSWHVESHVHLIIGANPLAASRCAKSLEAGAKPLLIAPEATDLHYTLSEHISQGKIQWIRRDFVDDDLSTLGREEVDRVVDAVFVTLGASHPLSRCPPPPSLTTELQRGQRKKNELWLMDRSLKAKIFHGSVDVFAFRLTYQTLRICVPSHCYPLTLTVRCTSA